MSTKLFLVRVALEIAAIWFAWRAGVATGAGVMAPNMLIVNALRKPFFRNAAASVGFLIASWLF